MRPRQPTFLRTGASFLARSVSSGPRLAKAKVVAESDGVTTEIGEKCHTFMIDEPKQLGGKGEAASPLGHFLGGLIGCTQITLHTIAQEQQIAIGKVRWRAVGKFDLRGLRKDSDEAARFREIRITGQLDTYFPERRLADLVKEIERRCIVSSTVNGSPYTEVITELKASPKNFKSSMGSWMDLAS